MLTLRTSLRPRCTRWTSQTLVLVLTGAGWVACLIWCAAVIDLAKSEPRFTAVVEAAPHFVGWLSEVVRALVAMSRTDQDATVLARLHGHASSSTARSDSVDVWPNSVLRHELQVHRLVEAGTPGVPGLLGGT